MQLKRKTMFYTKVFCQVWVRLPGPVIAYKDICYVQCKGNTNRLRTLTRKIALTLSYTCLSLSFHTMPTSYILAVLYETRLKVVSRPTKSTSSFFMMYVYSIVYSNSEAVTLPSVAKLTMVCCFFSFIYVKHPRKFMPSHLIAEAELGGLSHWSDPDSSLLISLPVQ
jgi:hypothetical protein